MLTLGALLNCAAYQTDKFRTTNLLLFFETKELHTSKFLSLQVIISTENRYMNSKYDDFTLIIWETLAWLWELRLWRRSLELEEAWVKVIFQKVPAFRTCNWHRKCCIDIPSLGSTSCAWDCKSCLAWYKADHVCNKKDTKHTLYSIQRSQNLTFIVVANVILQR